MFPDVARLRAGGELAADKFYNGQPFDFALWRIPAANSKARQ